jgi:predicted nuclease of predicted toxin-antitoxin system
MPDIDILAWAVREQRLVVTQEKDFGELVFLSGQPHAGVLLLRVEDAKSDEKVQIVEALFASYGDQLPGRFSVYQDGRLRIRWLTFQHAYLFSGWRALVWSEFVKLDA